LNRLLRNEVAFAGIPKNSSRYFSEIRKNKETFYSKLFNKVASSGAIKVIKKNGIEGVKFFGNYTSTFTKNNYRYNLKVLTKFDPGLNADAHHIFPRKKELVVIFEKAGINIHNPKYLVWWKKGKGLSDSHQKFAQEYNKEWIKWFKENPFPTKSEILEQGKQIMKKYNNGNNITKINY